MVAKSAVVGSEVCRASVVACIAGLLAKGAAAEASAAPISPMSIRIAALTKLVEASSPSRHGWIRYPDGPVNAVNPVETGRGNAGSARSDVQPILGRRQAKSSPKSRAEMAVARKAELKRELCDVIAVSQPLKRADEP
jgi:hypothetical protein